MKTATPPTIFFLIAKAIDERLFLLVEELIDSVPEETFESYRTELDVGLTYGSIADVTVARFYMNNGSPNVAICYS